jgi:hypothetical protein|tara:strand:+ start:387 stop:680 length:294 start_codon:yes stop_codon:yes gene_type:complete
MRTRVENLRSSNNNFVANQFEIMQTNKRMSKRIFQSYNTIICEQRHDNKGLSTTLDTHALQYSRTTSKYLYLFLGMNRKQIEEQIKENKIKLTNLNK